MADTIIHFFNQATSQLVPVRAVDNGDGTYSLALEGAVTPFAALLEAGVVELIGVDEQVDQNRYSDEVERSLGGTYSGEVLSILLIATNDGTGAVQRPNGKLIILDATPAVALNAASLGAAAWPTVLGVVPIVVGDWTPTDTSGAAAFKSVAVPFHALSSLWFVWFQEAATAWNDVGTDNEQLELNFWYRRES